jgi:hypothetical protein
VSPSSVSIGDVLSVTAAYNPVTDGMEYMEISTYDIRGPFTIYVDGKVASEGKSACMAQEVDHIGAYT